MNASEQGLDPVGGVPQRRVGPGCNQSKKGGGPRALVGKEKGVGRKRKRLVPGRNESNN